jgi:hypothetical protein
MRMSHIVICGFPCPTIFSTLSHKRQDFQKTNKERKICFYFLYVFCLKHFSFQDELSEIRSKMYVGLHVKCPLFLSDINSSWISSSVFRKKLSNFLKIRLVRAELCHEEGQSDRQTLFTILRKPKIGHSTWQTNTSQRYLADSKGQVTNFIALRRSSEKQYRTVILKSGEIKATCHSPEGCGEPLSYTAIPRSWNGILMRILPIVQGRV